MCCSAHTMGVCRCCLRSARRDLNKQVRYQNLELLVHYIGLKKRGPQVMDYNG
jgi:hypothetical protein